eukprot:4880116-Amphidinium_carterae.1
MRKRSEPSDCTVPHHHHHDDLTLRLLICETRQSLDGLQRLLESSAGQAAQSVSFSIGDGGLLKDGLT